MNKYMTLGVLVLFMILTGYFITMLDAYDPNAVYSTSYVVKPATNDSFSFWENAKQIGSAYISLLTFSIEGIPAIIVIIIFYPITIIVGYMTVDVIKDLIPFT